MRIAVFDNIKAEQKKDAISLLVTHSTRFQDFLLMLILSLIMATIGLLMNNVAIIIGSMLIAPVLYPIMGISMGIVIVDKKMIFRSIQTFAQMSFLGVVTAIVVTLFMYAPGMETGLELTPELLLRIRPHISDIAIAIVAGLAASFALVKPSLNATLPGVAISVALVPPLAVVGIGIATLNLHITSGALSIFLLNTLGILVASVVTFSIMNFYAKRDIVKVEIKKEDQALEKELNGRPNTPTAKQKNNIKKKSALAQKGKKP